MFPLPGHLRDFTRSIEPSFWIFRASQDYNPRGTASRCSHVLQRGTPESFFGILVRHVLPDQPNSPYTNHCYSQLHFLWKDYRKASGIHIDTSVCGCRNCFLLRYQARCKHTEYQLLGRLLRLDWCVCQFGLHSLDRVLPQETPVDQPPTATQSKSLWRYNTTILHSICGLVPSVVRGTLEQMDSHFLRKSE